MLFPARKPYHPTFSCRSKNPFPLSEYYTQLHTCGTSTSSPQLKGGRVSSLALLPRWLSLASETRQRDPESAAPPLSPLIPFHFLPNFKILEKQRQACFQAIAEGDLFYPPQFRRSSWNFQLPPQKVPNKHMWGKGGASGVAKYHPSEILNQASHTLVKLRYQGRVWHLDGAAVPSTGQQEHWRSFGLLLHF